MHLHTLPLENGDKWNRIPEVYETEQLRVFFDSIKDEHLYLIFEVLLKRGLREQEAEYLTWEHRATICRPDQLSSQHAGLILPMQLLTR